MMRTFFILLKKEIRELLTWQIIIPIVLVAGIFLGLGSLLGSEQKKAEENQRILLIDRDNSPASLMVRDTLQQAKFKVEVISDQSPAEIIKTGTEKNTQIALAIPKDFGVNIQKGTPSTLETYTILRDFSLMGNKSSAILTAAIDALNTYFSNQLISTNSVLKSDDVLHPIKTKENVALGDKIAEGNAQAVLGFITTQTTFIPIILFLVITFAAQMIATAVASEKENKTIETLLTMPISRKQIVTAKMLAAGLIAFLAAGVYLIGMRSYMNGLMGSTSSQLNDAAKAAVDQLGLVLHPMSYFLLGLSLFMGILVALAISLIIGAFAEDVKGVQGLISPLMILILIPYFLTMFLDLSSMSPAIKYAVYAIPFTHPFLAAPDLFLQRTNEVLLGIAYQALCFALFVTIAGKIFTTDRIVTMKLSFAKKKATA